MGGSVLWPWLTFAALGAYHGINPSMGWLFAVALGLQDKSRRAVLQALPPIALGHAASIAGIVMLMGAAQVMLPHSVVRALAAVVVLGYGIRRLLRTRHPRWVGMRVGPRDLATWSFVMSSAHGAGLMLVPVLLRCGAGRSGPAGLPHGLALATFVPQVTHFVDPGVFVAAVGVHTLSLLAVSGVVAVIVYEKMGLALLRRAWVNLDLLWSLALLGAGITILIL
jgi:hypothetical protein